MDIDLTVEALKDIKSIFDKYEIEFWLTYGTLLGAIRDGRIFEWDHDVDLSMWVEDRGKLFSALEEFGRRYHVAFVAEVNPLNQIIQLKIQPFNKESSTQIDIYLWQESKEKYINPTKMYKTGLSTGLLRIIRHYSHSNLELAAFDWPFTDRPILRKKPFQIILSGLKHTMIAIPQKIKRQLFNVLQNQDLGSTDWIFFTPKIYYEGFTTTSFYGLDFRIPNNAEDYLEYLYGKNWKIPKKKWDWENDSSAKNWENQEALTKNLNLQKV